MKPLKFSPCLVEKVWGGEKIAAFKGVKSDNERIGESWELSAVDGNVSVVSEGPFAGRTLTDLIREYGAMIVGEKVYQATGEEFPILVKFIDARQDLSIQVHPSDNLASRIKPGMKGKTEMWYVVGASEGAHLLSGLKHDMTQEEYERRVNDGTITDALCDYHVSAGDVFFLPAGRIHAIGAGVFVAEIQETSDITYRIFDYNRPGLDGKPRKLHTVQAEEAIDYKAVPCYRTEYSQTPDKEITLVDCPYFNTRLLELSQDFRKDISDLDSFLIVVCTSGSGTIIAIDSDDSVSETPVRQGETILVCATTKEVTFHPEGKMTCLAVCMD